MWIRDLSGLLLAKLSDAIETRRRLSGFQCADCSRADRCGLLPDDQCIVKIAHIEEGHWPAPERRGRPPLW